MLALHFENLLFLLFIAVAFLFQLLTRAANKAGKGPDETTRRSITTPRTPPPLPRAPVETDEERIRKFLEALGQPAGSKPPPPVVHRTDIPPRPVAPIQPPPSMRPFSGLFTPEEQRKRSVILHEETAGEPGEWLHKIDHPAQALRPPVERKLFIPKTPEPTAFEVHAGSIPSEPPAISKTPGDRYATATQPVAGPQEMELNIVAVLKSASGLRGAIILREIFGPPRSLQPLELVL
jgi:hypothetical protein